MSGGFGGGGGGGGQVQQQQVQQAPQEEEKPVCKNVKTDMDQTLILLQAEPAQKAGPKKVDVKLVKFPEANKFKVLKEIRILKPGLNLMDVSIIFSNLLNYNAINFLLV